MLIKIASNEKLAHKFGPLGAMLIRDWPYGTEIRWKEEVVIFFDETGQWMVGFKFNDIIMAGAIGTPKQFEDEVKRLLRETREERTLPQRVGRLW